MNYQVFIYLNQIGVNYELMKWEITKFNVITHIKHKWKHFYQLERELTSVEFINLSQKGALLMIAGNHMRAKIMVHNHKPQHNHSQ